MSEAEWWEFSLEKIQAGEAADLVVESYFQEVDNPERSPEDVEEIVRGMERSKSADLPPYLVISSPEMADLTPDDLTPQPAWSRIEVQRLFDIHDGRSYGTMILAVYKLNRDALLPIYIRDTEWGMLGDEGKTRPANPDDTTDFINAAP